MIITKAFRIQTIVIFLISFLLHIIAFSTTFWYSKGDPRKFRKHLGLWEKCETNKQMQDVCVSLINSGGDHFETSQVHSCQALMAIAVVLNVLAGSLFITWIACGKSRLSESLEHKLPIIAHATCILSGVLTCISAAIYGSYYASMEKGMSWSFALACISGGLLVVVSAVCLPMVVHSHRTEAERQPKLELSTDGTSKASSRY